MCACGARPPHCLMHHECPTHVPPPSPLPPLQLRFHTFFTTGAIAIYKTFVEPSDQHFLAAQSQIGFAQDPACYPAAPATPRTEL